MKAIGIKMVELQPMTANEACIRNYKTNGLDGSQEGYEVTYPDGYKSWCPKEVADKAYFKLSENNNGNTILKEDIENFIAKRIVKTINQKTTFVHVTTITGFEQCNASSCVSPENYSKELGEKYAMATITNSLWQYLGFVLQWAKNGLNQTKEENMNGMSIEDKSLSNDKTKENTNIPLHIQRMVIDYANIIKRTNSLANFKETDAFKNLPAEEQDGIRDQYYHMIECAKSLKKICIKYKLDVSEFDKTVKYYNVD